MRAARLAVVVSALLAGAGEARAQYDFVGVRALGEGEAVRASASGAESVLTNPAAMSLARQYVIEANYAINIEQLGHHAHVSITDSVTSRVAAGLFYTYINASPKLGFDWAGGRVESTTISRQGHAAGLALSLPLGDKFIIGATIKYLHIDTTAPLPAPAVPKEITLDSVNGVTFDLSILVRLGEKFRITAIGYNLWDHGSRESPLSLGLAVGFSPIPQLTINFDAVTNFTGYKSYSLDPTGKVVLDTRVTGRLGPGIEWLIANKVPLRAGVVYDSGLPGTFLTVGLGYVSTSWGVDLGYRAKVQGGIENFLGVGVRIFID